MPQILGRHLSKRDIQRYWGSLWPAAGLTRYTLDEGKGKGSSIVEMRTGTGLRVHILLDRGLDIGFGEYRGMPLSFRSAVGDVAPQFFEPEGYEWLRSFGGGLLTTCGLTYAGAPSRDRGENLGLHGRISHTPAEEIALETMWHDDACRLRVRGMLREAKTLHQNIVLFRQVEAEVGTNKIYIDDRVVNEHFQPVPHMFLYHVNIGYPLLDQGAELISASTSVEPRDATAAADPDWRTYSAPQPNYPDTAFYHHLERGADGFCSVGVINQALGMGIYIKFDPTYLDRFIQWKHTTAGFYATGLEPANCWVQGRAAERERNSLVFLEPGEERQYRLEIGLLTSPDQISQWRTHNNLGAT